MRVKSGSLWPTSNKLAQLRGIAAWVLCAAVSVCAAAPTQAVAQQSTQRVTADEGRVLVDRLLGLGQPAAAREIALGLLDGQPDDVRVLVGLARAEMALGRTAAAERAAQAALTAADTRTEQFIAALVVADVFARTDRFTRSQIWLRRAQNLADSDTERRVVANAYRAVRQLNPLTVQLQFGLTPSSNVNSGNSNQSITLAYLPAFYATIPWAVPASDRPLSGVEISADANLRYRLAATESSLTTMDFGVYARTYIMSQSARDTAPSVTGESLSYGELSLGVAHQWVPDGATGRQFATALTYKRAFTVDGATSQTVTADLSVEQRLTDEDSLSFGISVEGYDSLRSDATAVTTRLRGVWARALDGGRAVTGAATVARANSNDINRDYSSASLAASYGFGEILPQIDLSTTAQAEWRTYDRVSLDPAGRDDLTTSLQVAAGFGGLEIFGFEPVVTLRAQRTDSTVPYYDTENVTMGVSFRSSF